MKNLVYTSCLLLSLFANRIAAQTNYFTSSGPAAIGIATNAANSLLINRPAAVSPATPLYTPILHVQDLEPTGFSQIGIKGTARQFHVGVGNASAGLSLANKFFVFDATSSLARMVIDATGKVGIGTSTPQTPLDLKELRLGHISGFPAEGAILEGVWGNYIIGDISSAQQLRLGVSNDLYTKAEILIDNSNRPDGTISFKTSNTTGATTRMFINGDGNVSVGTTDAKGYKFAVNGDAIFTKIKVKLNADWPDYVFDANYNLPSLQEIDAFIKVNKHLPGIPSAEEVEKNGIDIEDSQISLLKKIEELTLILIEQNKQITALSARVDELSRIRE